MKHFVYLDIDIINSYLAQLNDGLINSVGKENVAEVTEGKQLEDNPITDESTIGINIPGIFNYKHNINSEYITEVNTITQTNAGREIISKIIHDNSYDELFDYLSESVGIKQYNNSESINTGTYIELSGNLRMVDLSALLSLFDEDFRNVYSTMINGEFSKSLENFNREERRSNETKKNQNQNKNKVKSDVKMFKNVTDVISYIAKLLPSDKYIIYEDILIPLDEKHLREDYNSLRYKYSNDSIIFGQITGTVKDVMQFSLNAGGALTPMFLALDDLLLSVYNLLGIDENFKLMHPISWYYQ